MTTNPPFPFDRYDTSKYSLVEIGEEFIMWDTTGPYVTGEPWSDEDRCRWIMLAIEFNFPESEWETKFQEFPEAYELSLIEEPSHEAAPVENIRELVKRRPLWDWPSKEELYNWPRGGSSREPDHIQQDIAFSKSALSSYEPPAEDETIVWIVDDHGDVYIRGIYDDLYATTASHGTYREFVNMASRLPKQLFGGIERRLVPVQCEPLDLMPSVSRCSIQGTGQRSNVHANHSVPFGYTRKLFSHDRMKDAAIQPSHMAAYPD